MKVLITGANGGVGRNLIQALNLKHDVTCLIKPSHHIDPSHRNLTVLKGDVRDVAFMEKATKNTDVLIHAAASFGKGLYESSMQGLDSIVNALSKNKHKLFVYISSMVVYSNQAMPSSLGYDETMPLSSQGDIDPYTKSKIDGEKKVIEACEREKINYIILRPTIIFGEYMTWTKIGLGFAKWFPFAISDHLTDFVHVKDFSEVVLRLISNEKAYNQIFNVGGKSYLFDDFLKIAARPRKRKISFRFPLISQFLASKATSSFWYLQKDVLINSDKVREFTEYRDYQSLENYFDGVSLKSFAPKSTEEFVNKYASYKNSYTAIGKNYSFLFSHEPFGKSLLQTTQFNKILDVTGNQVRVQCGITLTSLTEELDRLGLTLPTLPEFLEVTLGACFATPVHGSSYLYPNLASVASSVTYLRDGKIETIPKGCPTWDKVIFSNHPDTLFLEATLDCIPSHYMSRSIEWHPEEVVIPNGLSSLFQNNHSCTVEWYPWKKMVMVWKMNKLDKPPEKIRKVPQFIRSNTPSWMRHIPFKKGLFIDKSHNILGSWKSLRKLFLYAIKNSNVIDCEIAVPMDKIDIFLAEVQKETRVNKKPLKSLGFRCSGEDSVQYSPSYQKKMVWVEIATPEISWIEKIREIASHFGYKAHWGKYLIPPSTLATTEPRCAEECTPSSGEVLSS